LNDEGKFDDQRGETFKTWVIERSTGSYSLVTCCGVACRLSCRLAEVVEVRSWSGGFENDETVNKSCSRSNPFVATSKISILVWIALRGSQ